MGLSFFQKRFIQYVMLVALVVVCYYPSLKGSFIWDDLDYIADNATLQSAAGLKAVWLDPKATPNYYPSFFTSLWLQHQLWGKNVIGYHIVTVIFHIFNAIFIWLLFDRLKIPGAFAAALIFAVHPVNVESVAWMAELKNTQSVFFMLLSIFFFMDRKRPFYYTLSLLMFFIAVTTKTVSLVLCGVIPLVLWLENIKFRWTHVFALLPFLLTGVCLAIPFIESEHHYMTLSDSVISIPLAERGLMAGRSFWFYPFKFLWPEPLMFLYTKWPLNTESAFSYVYLAGVLLLIGILAFKWKSVSKGLRAAFLYYGMVFLPASGLMVYQNLRLSYVADHFQYLPSIVFSALFVNAGIFAFARTRLGRSRVKQVVFAVCIVCLCVLSWRHAEAFKSRIAIYSDTIKKDSHNALAYNLRGRAYVGEGKYGEALADFDRAIELNSDYYKAINNRAVVYIKFRRYKKAMRDIKRVLELHPGDDRALGLRSRMTPSE